MKLQYWIALAIIVLFGLYSLLLWNLSKEKAISNLVNRPSTPHVQSGTLQAKTYSQEYVQTLLDSLKVYYAVADSQSKDNNFRIHLAYLSDTPIPAGSFQYDLFMKPDTIFINNQSTPSAYEGTRLALEGGVRLAIRDSQPKLRLVLGAEYKFVDTQHFEMLLQYEAEFRQLNLSGIDHQLTWINRIKF